MHIISNIMDVLDRNGMNGQYLAMDNAPIHTPAEICDLIESRGYKCLYLPPISPFVNPIEEFWSKLKLVLEEVHCLRLNILSDRICESVQYVNRSD